MGRRFTFLVAAGLAVACALVVGGQVAIADEATIENVAASDWMSVLEDERYISDIAIPGSHASYAKDFFDGSNSDAPPDANTCTGGFYKIAVSIGNRDVEPYCRRQDMTIYDQLNSGVRLIELDVSCELFKDADGTAIQPTFEQAVEKAICYHPCTAEDKESYSVAYRYYHYYSLDQVKEFSAVRVYNAWSHALSPFSEPGEHNNWMVDYGDVDRFLQEHPTETVLLVIKKAKLQPFDATFADEPATYACIDRLLDELENTGRLYRGQEIPQLEDVRGKIVLLNTPGIDNDSNHNNPNHRRYEFYKDFYHKPWIDGGISLTLGQSQVETDGVTFTMLGDQTVTTPGQKVNKLQSTLFENARNAEFPTKGSKGDRSAFVYTSGFKGDVYSWGIDPQPVAQKVNPAIEDFVANELQPNHNIGWLLSDFVGTSLQPSTIFRTNTPLQVSETDPDPDLDPDPDPDPQPDPDPDPEPAPAPAPVPAPTFQGHEMHRLYNPNSGEHFYTASAGERDAAVAAGWAYEGIGWTAPVPTQGIATKPVYRLYNQFAGDHHYTQSLEERNALIGLGWTYEGVGWYSGGPTALWRQYNPNAVTGTHNYTPSSEERFALVALGWRDEGVAWYGL